MIKENFHTHTARCGHAVGSDEEYVQKAVQAGLTILGFSDHAAYRQPDPGERMNIEQVPDYIQSVLALKEKYRDRIEIHLGMEVECYRSEWDTLREYRKNMEYLILGQHQLDIHGKSCYDLTEPEELEEYTDRIAYACDHALCDIIAHPDVCLWSYPVMDETVTAIAERIADLSLQYDIPVELNAGSGVRSGLQQYEDIVRYPYPTRAFFEVFARKHCKVILGLDVHEPDLFLTDKYINRCLDVIEGLDIHLLEHYDLIGEAAKRKRLFQ
jgi:histidinol-phosphatase (PHP family)